MADHGRGMPLLSGPPPHAPPSDTCRKCSKEFNIIFTRSRTCNHCGYLYCHSCSDFQALMPRTAVGEGGTTGYDVMPVCAYCAEFLTITAAGRATLKKMPLSTLKKYINAYNIKSERAVEKDDLIDAIIHARAPNGCLPRPNEDHYRRYSVPSRSQARSRGLFSSRSGQSNSVPPPPPPRPARAPTQEFPRPDLTPDDPPHPPPRSTRPPQEPQPQQHYTPPPPPPPPQPNYYQYPQSYQPFPMPQYHTPPPAPPNEQWFHYPPPPPPQHSRPAPPPAQPPYHTRPSPSRGSPRPPPAPPRPRTTSTAPPPTLNQLLTMEDDTIKALSISTLKAVLFTNHVNAGQILEKSDLVAKVRALIEDEKRERERQRVLEEMEQLEMMRREEARREVRMRAVAAEAAERERAAAAAEGGKAGITPPADGAEGNNSESAAPPSSPPPQAPKTMGSASTLERTGLCVICQDEEANIAIVDCGHMAMCRGCSDLIMASSRECPLCRTRIVTEARLLRIFKA